MLALGDARNTKCASEPSGESGLAAPRASCDDQDSRIGVQQERSDRTHRFGVMEVIGEDAVDVLAGDAALVEDCELSSLSKLCAIR